MSVKDTPISILILADLFAGEIKRSSANKHSARTCTTGVKTDEPLLLN